MKYKIRKKSLAKDIISRVLDTNEYLVIDEKMFSFAKDEIKEIVKGLYPDEKPSKNISNVLYLKYLLSTIKVAVDSGTEDLIPLQMRLFYQNFLRKYARRVKPGNLDHYGGVYTDPDFPGTHDTERITKKVPESDIIDIRDTSYSRMIYKFTGPFSWLSNWHRVPIPFEGRRYPSAYNAYQSAKSKSVKYKNTCQSTLSPYAMQFIAYNTLPRPDWELVKDNIMYTVLKIKFSIPKYRDLLLGTGEVYLLNGNRYNETYWGYNLNTEQGYNKLGLMLMKIREELKDEEIQSLASRTKPLV